MNEKYQRAVILKYEGKTYKEIAAELGGELTEGTLAQYFSRGGILEMPYEQYCIQMGRTQEANGRAILKKEVPNMVKVLIKTVALHLEAAKRAKDAGKLDEELKHYEKATVYAEKVLDRAGLTVVQKVVGDPVSPLSTPITSYEQFKQHCIERGIDPVSGLTIDEAKALEDQSVSSQSS